MGLTGEREYLVCGEDYQGHTVVDLDAETAHVFLHDRAEIGNGFCWREIHPSPNGNHLLVEGCYWACDFEWRVLDFTRPATGPFPVIAFLGFIRGDFYEDSRGPAEVTWLDDDHVQLDGKDEIDLRDDKSLISGRELARRYLDLAHMFAEQ